MVGRHHKQAEAHHDGRLTPICREHVSEGEVRQPAVAARHFEGALAIARQSAARAALQQQSALAAAQRPAADGGGDSMDTEDAAASVGGASLLLGAEDRTADAAQSAWIKAAAARAADEVRQRMADDATAEVARLKAYIGQLEAALQARG
jgi:hypothetical protein